MSAFQIQGPPQPDNQLAYVEFTSTVTISSTSAASPNDVVSAGAVSFNGSDTVCIEFYCPALVGASSGFQGKGRPAS